MCNNSKMTAITVELCSILGRGCHKVKARKTDKELDRYHRSRSEENGIDLKRSATVDREEWH